MANTLVTAIGQNKETFKDCRLYLLEILKTKEKVLQLEEANANLAIPYYIAYIESKGISMQEAMNYYAYGSPSSKYWDLLVITVVNTFRKIEANDLTFTPF